MADLINQDGTLASEIYRVSGNTVETAQTAWHKSGNTITQIFPQVTTPPPPPQPRNTYSAWSNVGNPYNQITDTQIGAFGPYSFSSTPLTQEFLNESRSRTVTTVVTASQDQSRTRTASGGCDGPFTRTVNVEISRTTTTQTETRVSTTPNPNYRAPFSQSDLAQFVQCSIDRNTGRVTVSQRTSPVPRDAEGNEITFDVTLAPGQQDTFPTIPAGSSSIERDVEVRVQGETPSGFQGDGDLFDEVITISCFQRAADPTPADLTVTVSWTDAFGRQEERTRRNENITLTGAIGDSYTVSASSRTPGATFTGEGTFEIIDIDGTTGTPHTITASATNFSTATITVTIFREDGGEEI